MVLYMVFEYFVGVLGCSAGFHAAFLRMTHAVLLGLFVCCFACVEIIQGVVHRGLFSALVEDQILSQRTFAVLLDLVLLKVFVYFWPL